MKTSNNLTKLSLDCQFDDKEGRSIAEYYKTEAEKNGRVFIPIKLHCYDMDNLRRVENPDRMLRGSHKILDRKVLQEMLDIPLKIYGFEGHKHALTFDISLFPPYQSASRLMEHIYGIAMDNLVPHTWP